MEHNKQVALPRKVLRADYSQSASHFPLVSRGKQCVSNCYMFLLFTQFVNIAPSLSRHDLHAILEAGDILYTSLRKSEEFLLISELPNHIKFRQKYYSSYVKKHFVGCMGITESSGIGVSLESCLNRTFAKTDNAILIFHSSAVAVKHQGGLYYVFDSHNRGTNGLCDPEGKCAVSMFNCFQDLCHFLRNLCQSISSTELQKVQYESCAITFRQLCAKPHYEFVNINDCQSRFVLNNNFNTSHVVDGFTLGKRVYECYQNDEHSANKKRCCEMNEDVRKHNVSCISDQQLLKCKIDAENISQKPDFYKIKKGKENTLERNKLNKEVHAAIVNFKNIVANGPSYICSCCTQTWFREGVFKAESLQSSQFAISYLLNLKSAENSEWVCSTCYRYLKSGKIPVCSVRNGFVFPERPPQLEITEMEERLISPRIPFMQIMEKPRGGQKSLRGNVVNVPSDVNETVKCLPRMFAETETIQVKLKRKNAFKHHVLHEPVRPNKCLDALQWLIVNSELFRNEGITINANWNITEEQREWLDLNREHTEDNSEERVISPEVEDIDNWTEDPNFHTRLTGNTDTLMHPTDVRSLIQNFSFAPGENQTPLGLYQDPHAEYLAFPTIFCGQDRLSNKDRLVPVTYSTICKWELRSQDRRVACSMPNLFFKLKKIQVKQIQDKVTLAMRKCQKDGKKITAKQVLNPAGFDNIVRLNEGYRVLRTLRGSPAYWENAKKDVFAMIRQLGIPTWFCSFSAAETKWNSLLKILSKLLNNREMSDEEIFELSWTDKCELIKKDPVTCSRYFHHRFQVFMRKILKSSLNPLGKIVDFFFRVEFQQRGSPHIHMLLWIENAPIYGETTTKEIETFIDRHCKCSKNEEISELINYQTHKHARTCKKRGKNVCRFNFPLPPMPETKILEPLDDKEFEENANVQQNYLKIFEYLNDIKIGEDITFEDFLKKLEMTFDSYILAVRSSLKSAKVFLQRNVSEIRINSYNEVLLRAWEANIDVQFVLDGYACAAYIVSYISKSQRGMSNLLHEACEEARNGNMSLKQQVRQIGNKFLTHVEISAQEAAYLILQMPLRNSSRSVVFVNTNEPGQRTFLLKPMESLQELPDSSTDIESDNSIKRYQRRPKSLQNCCLADFISKFDVVFPAKDKRQQHKNLSVLPEDEREEIDDDDILQEMDTGQNNNEKEYEMKDGSVLKRRKTQKILRYVRFNKEQDPENYFREQLMLFFPWRNEDHDLKGNFASYELCFIHNQETEIVENNMLHLSFESNHIVSAEIQHEEELDSQQVVEICEKNGCFNPQFVGAEYDIGSDLGITRKQIESNDIVLHQMSDTEYQNKVRSLNEDQKLFFYHVLHMVKTGNFPFYYFLTGGAGVGKSLLTTCLYQAITRYFAKQPGENLDEIKTVLCAPTGKAAYNIGGQTIHSLFCIPANQNLCYKPLDAQQLDTMRVKFRRLKIIFIDEISMVGNKMFNFINLRLQEIFARNIPFGGLNIIAIGDLFQLKPVFDGWIFENLQDGYGPLATNLWTELFQVFELKEIMRQKEDKDFAQLLNRLREGLQTEQDMEQLKTRKSCLNGLQNVNLVPHLFTTNAKVNSHNMEAYNCAATENKCSVSAVDTVGGDVATNVKNRILAQVSDNPSNTMGLHKELHLVKDLPAEICVNVNVQDGLTNGSPCVVKKLDFRVPGFKRCSIVWVLFDEPSIGSATRIKYAHLYTKDICKSWTPIMEISQKFSVGRHKSCYVTRRQFPMRLACAKTIHKAQGSTLNDVVVDLGTRKQEHMHYVALSRVRKLQNLFILSLNEQKITVSSNVVSEMQRLRENAVLRICLPILKNIASDLKIIYQNCRSLHLHIKDVCAEKNLTLGNIIAFSESRLVNRDKNEDYLLPGFHMYRFDANVSNDLERPNHGMVVYSQLELKNPRSFTLCGIETVLVSFDYKDSILDLVFIYCPPKKASISNLCQYLISILQMLESDHQILIMGDTNIDYFSQERLSSFIQKSKFRQIMHSCTRDYGTCLDHIYTSIKSNSDISCATLDSYYSDHKPIIAYLPM